MHRFSPIDVSEDWAATALVRDECCPSFTVYLRIVVLGGNDDVSRPRDLLSMQTALGCCLPTGQCGGAPPAQVLRQTSMSDWWVSDGWKAPDRCYRYYELPPYPAPPDQKTCRYPYRVTRDAATTSVDAAADDASVHDASSDRSGDSGDR
jgi:hypothetical protein